VMRLDALPRSLAIIGGGSIAAELGMNMDGAIRQTYADLYRQARRTRSDLPENMVFAPEDL